MNLILPAAVSDVTIRREKLYRKEPMWCISHSADIVLLWCTTAEQPNMRLGSWSFKYFPAPTALCPQDIVYVNGWWPPVSYPPTTIWFVFDCDRHVGSKIQIHHSGRMTFIWVSPSKEFLNIQFILGGYSWGNDVGRNVESWNRKYLLLFSHES